MTWRKVTGAVLIAAALAAAGCTKVGGPAAAEPPFQEAAGPGVQYVPGGAPAGMGQAAVVKGVPLVYTRQVLALDRDGKLVGEGSLDKQVDQVLANLETILAAAGSSVNRLVRLNICAMSVPAADLVRQRLAARLDRTVRPAITAIQSPLPHRKALVAVDAVAAAEKAPDKPLQRVAAVAGDAQCADFAVMPVGGAAYLSGQPEKGELAPASAKSLSTLLASLEPLKIKPAQVVQVKVFLTPVTAADVALAEVKKLFPGQLTPPVVFVEWLASAPVEIELVAALPIPEKPAATVEFYNPPDVKASPDFSRVALVRTDRQVFISGLASQAPGEGEDQARDVFAQLKAIVGRTGGDALHLAKATYFVCDDDASNMLNKVRSEYLDPARPPAASKVTMHGVGRSGRSLLVDMIAVGSKLPETVGSKLPEKGAK